MNALMKLAGFSTMILIVIVVKNTNILSIYQLKSVAVKTPLNNLNLIFNYNTTESTNQISSHKNKYYNEMHHINSTDCSIHKLCLTT